MTQQFYCDPTQVSNGTGSIGSPFNSLRNALLGIDTAFSTASEDYIIELLPGSDTDVLSGGVYSIGSSGGVRNLIIRATGTNRHTGVRGTGYRRTQDIKIIGGNANITVQLIGIAGSGHIEISGSTSMTAIVDSCLVYDSADFGFANGGGTVTWKNCAAYQCADRGFWDVNDSANPTSKYINCTAIACATYGFERWSGTPVLKNCYSGGNTTEAYGGSGSMTFTNCAHSTATSFTGSTASVAYSTANFTNVTSGSQNAKLASGSALIGAGVGPSSDSDVPSVDFESTARSGTTTDIGFDQRTASGGTAGNASGLIDTATASSISGSASSARSVTITLRNNAGILLSGVTRRFWTRATLDAAAADGGSTGLSFTCDSSGVFVINGLTVAGGAGWLTYKDPSDDLNCHNIPVTFG
jgi:hypothetical protein